MEGSTLVLIGGAIVFMLSVMVYVVLMAFFPEWVGIAGKVASEAERSHHEGSKPNEDEFFNKL